MGKIVAQENTSPSSESLLGCLCFDFLLFLVFFDDLVLPDVLWLSSKYLSERLVAVGENHQIATT